MNADIEVKQVELKGSPEKPWVLISATSGTTFSVWPDAKKKELFDSARALKPGMRVVLDYKQNGNYSNVSGIVVSQHVNGVEPVDKPKPYLNDSKEMRISYLACNNNAKDVLGLVLQFGDKLPGSTLEQKFDVAMQMVQTASKGLMRMVKEESGGGN